MLTNRLAVAGCAAVVLLAAPGLALASCGDYVHIGNPKDAALSESASASAPRNEQSPAPAPVAPCRGPNCSSNQSLPAPPVAPKVLPTREISADRVAACAAPGDGLIIRRGPDGEFLYSAPIADRLDRPPR